MPYIYHEDHTLLVNQFVQSNDIVETIEVSGFLKHSSGYLIEVSKRLCQFPSILNGNEFVVSINETQYELLMDKCAVVFDCKHELVGMTARAMRILNISSPMDNINEAIERAN